jgi:hypothetical protein
VDVAQSLWRKKNSRIRRRNARSTQTRHRLILPVPSGGASW